MKYHDAETDKTLVFLTNNFSLPAMTIAELYRCRWQVELFFRWIKQNLRIKTFYGTSENAVKAQIWIAVSVYVLVAIMKKRLKIEASLYTILQVLSVTIFERMPLLQALTDSDYEEKMTDEIITNCFYSTKRWDTTDLKSLLYVSVISVRSVAQKFLILSVPIPETHR